MYTLVACSVLSIAIPLACYGFFFLAGLAPASLSEAWIYLSLVTSNAVGLALAIIALSRSNPRPMDISVRIRLIVLLGSIGLLANIIAAEYVLTAAVFHMPIQLP